jgi:hypothetical protein
MAVVSQPHSHTILLLGDKEIKIMSYPHQNVIYGSVKSKEGHFLMCNQDALFAAMSDLKHVGLKMWLYLSKN